MGTSLLIGLAIGVAVGAFWHAIRLQVYGLIDPILARLDRSIANTVLNVAMRRIQNSKHFKLNILAGTLILILGFVAVSHVLFGSSSLSTPIGLAYMIFAVVAFPEIVAVVIYREVLRHAIGDALDNRKLCRKCGYNLRESRQRCPECGYVLKVDAADH